MLLYTFLTWNLLTAAASAAAVKWILPSLENDEAGAEGRKSRNPKAPFIAAILIVMLCSLAVPVTTPGLSAFSIFKIGITFGVLVVTFVTDYLYYRIPNILPAVLALSRAVLLVPEIMLYQSGALEGLIKSFLVAVAVLIILLFVRLVSKGGLGFGDVKVVSAMAFLCGFRAGLFTLLFSFTICAVVSSFLLIRRRKSLKDTLPLGPFLLVGFALTVILGVG